MNRPVVPHHLSAVLSLLAGVALLTAGNALLGTLVSVRMAIEDFSRPASGLVMSSYFVGFVLGCVYGARVIDRVGHIRAFAACAAALCASAALQPLAITPVTWILLRGVVGFVVAGQLMVAESWLNATATADTRGQTFSGYVITVYLAFGGGQLILALGNPAGPELFLAVAVLLSLSILPLVLTQTEVPALPPTPQLQPRKVFARAPLGLAGALASGIAVGSVQSIGPQFADALGLSVWRISQFMSAFFLSGILLQWPVGRLSDRGDRRYVLAAMAGAGALVCVGVALFADRSYLALIGLAIVGGGVLATLYPLSVAHANDRMQGEHVVATAATLLLTYGVGAATGPILATTAMMALGASGLFYTAALPCGVLAAYAFFRIGTHAAVEQGRFSPVAQTTQVMLELDPRAPHTD